MKKSVFTSLVVCVLIAIFLVPIGRGLTQDVDVPMDIALVSTNGEDMAEYITQLKENLEKREMTHGHFALVFKTLANDLSVYYLTLEQALESLDGIKDINKNKTAYQIALSDIRGTIRELPNIALRYLWTKYWFLYVLGFGIWIWPITYLFYFRDKY